MSKMSEKAAKDMPKTPREWALYRAKLSCKIGKGGLNDRSKVPENVSQVEWALFNLLNAVEDIALAMKYD